MDLPFSDRLVGSAALTEAWGCRAERLIPGGEPGPMSWGWWRFPASHRVHLPSVQTALEGVGLGLQTWSRHRFPGNPLLAAPCSERSPAPPGLALPPGSAPFAQAVCPWATSGLPRLLGVCTTAFSARTSLSSHPPLPLRLYPGWRRFFRSRLQSGLSAPFTQASVRESRLLPVSQQVLLFISGQWVSLSFSSPERLLAAQLPGCIS